MKITSLLFALLLTMSRLVAQQIQHINPAGLAKSPNYSHIVTAQGGRTVYISGQVSVNAQGEIVGKGDFRAQTKQVHENLKTALAAVGATFDDLVKLTAFVVNSDSERLGIVREIRSQYYNGPQRPASSYLSIQALYDKDILIEIEAIAVIKEAVIMQR